MRLAERVALRYASKGRYTIEEEDYYMSSEATHRFELKYNDEKYVGYVEGALDYITFDKDGEPDFNRFECKEDMERLWELWGSSFPYKYWEDGIPVLEITHSHIDEEHQNKKCGLLMYKTIANKVRKEVGSPIFFIPNYCHDRSTSDQARRVWKSLTTNNSSSSGDVIFLHEYRLRG